MLNQITADSARGGNLMDIALANSSSLSAAFASAYGDHDYAMWAEYGGVDFGGVHARQHFLRPGGVFGFGQ